MINTPDFEEYYHRTEAGMIAANRCLIRNADQQMRWSIILPLKNYFIDKKLFREMNGVELDTVFQKQFALLKEYGLATEDDKKFVLTEKGAFYSDELVHLFYEPQHQSFPASDFMEGLLNPYNQ